jgi:hypothetical protein
MSGADQLISMTSGVSAPDVDQVPVRMSKSHVPLVRGRVDLPDAGNRSPTAPASDASGEAAFAQLVAAYHADMAGGMSPQAEWRCSAFHQATEAAAASRQADAVGAL